MLNQRESSWYWRGLNQTSRGRVGGGRLAREGGRGLTALLEGRRIHDAVQQDRRSTAGGFQLRHELVERDDVVGFEAAAERVGEQLFAQAIVKVTAMRGRKDVLQFTDVAE